MTTDCDTNSVETARLAVQGRLLRSLVHELSNPLQALGGALSLASEDQAHPEHLQSDLDIMQKETRRMEVLLNTVRRLYRGADSAPLRQQFKEALLLARKELQWRNLSWEVDWGNADDALPADCPHARLTLLALLQLIAAATPENLPPARLRVTLTPERVHIQTPYPLPQSALPPQEHQTLRCLLHACRVNLAWESGQDGGRITLHWRGKGDA